MESSKKHREIMKQSINQPLSAYTKRLLDSGQQRRVQKECEYMIFTAKKLHDEKMNTQTQH